MEILGANNFMQIGSVRNTRLYFLQAHSISSIYATASLIHYLSEHMNWMGLALSVPRCIGWKMLQCLI